MPPIIEVTNLITAINGYFSATSTDKSTSLNIITAWFRENNKYYDSNRTKITATYIAHILKKQQETVFDRTPVQECLNKWLKKEAGELLDFFKSTEDAKDLYNEFITYKNKYYPNEPNPKEIKELNSKMNTALSELGVAPIDKSSLITEENILPLIQNKRLDIIKEHLQDIGKSKRISDKISTEITIDGVKDLFKESVLAKHIQSYNEVTSQNNLETDDDSISDPDFDENNPNDFDRTGETYTTFLEDSKSLQSRYDKQNKQDALAIDKALWVLASTDKQRAKVLEELKAYRTDKLKINLSVTKENNKFKIDVTKLERAPNGNEHNHIVPVSVFLKTLKYSLDKQAFSNINEIFRKLCSLYGRGYEKSVIFEFLKDKIVRTKRTTDSEFRYLLEDNVIPIMA